MPYGDVEAGAGGGFAGGGASGPGGPGGAGGLGTGTAEAVGDLAGALADALAGAQVDTFGSYAAQDAEEAQGGYSPGEQERMDAAAAAEERQALADRIAEIDAAIAGSTAAGSAGPGTTAAASDPNAPSAFVDDFGQMQTQAGVDVAANEFAGWEQPGSPTDPLGSAAGLSAATSAAGPAIEEAQMGMAAPMGQGAAPAQGYQDILGSDAGLAQATQFDQTQQGHPDFPGSAGVFGTGVEDFTGMPTGTMGQGGVSQNIGMIGAGTAQDSAGTVSPSGAGMINMGSVAGYDDTMTGGPVMDEGTLDPNAGGVSAPAPVEGQVELPSGVQDQIQRIPGDTTVTQLETGTPEYHAAQKEFIDKSIIQASEGLDQKAKEMREKHGLFSREYQDAQRLANAFKSLDQYSKAYSSTQGGSFLGQLISGALPLGAALKGITGWLESKGMYNKQTGGDLLAILEKAQAEGNLDSVMRDLQGGGPSDEDVQGPQEIRSFIDQYPWASELDPKYIQYLIDNPPALQELLGENEEG